MQALTYTEYGTPDVLHMIEKPKPTPKADEILIRIHATPIGYGDLMARNMKAVTLKEFNMPAPLLFPAKVAFGLRRPKVNILGSEIAGQVEAVGADVTHFQVGDDVFAYLGENMGGNAEYIAIKETRCVAHMPNNMSYVEASTIPYGVVMALPILKKANIQAGQKVLINGASGGMGMVMVQVAKHLGAHVTGVCSTQRVKTVKRLGADHVIDYKKDDFTQGTEQYDLVVDVLGKSAFNRVKRVLKPDGIYLLASFKTHHLLQMLWTKFVGSQKVICAMSSAPVEALTEAKALIEGEHLTTIIDRCYPLNQGADAHRYVEAGHKQGHIVLTTA